DGLNDSWDLQPGTYGSQGTNEFEVADFDGDGKDDVFKAGSDGKAWINLAKDGLNDYWDLQPGVYGKYDENEFEMGDFDGDSYEDILKIGDDGKAWIDYAGI
ncbi:MAG: hypothetical protein JW973_08550, partial [Bacteroidales bacterium]|nr:hypothetical protein [Bacteroidales bacterium]